MVATLSAQDALKQGKASQTLASYQKYTDELVNTYLKTKREPGEPDDDAARAAIDVINQYMQNLTAAHVAEHNADLLVGPECTAGIVACGTFLDNDVLPVLESANASVHTKRLAHQQCRDEQVQGCDAKVEQCNQYDEYRKQTVATLLPACARRGQPLSIESDNSHYALGKDFITADETTVAGQDTLNDMEACLEQMQMWLEDGFPKGVGFAQHTFPGPPGLYPRMCGGEKLCCEDAADCDCYNKDYDGDICFEDGVQVGPQPPHFCDVRQNQFEDAHCQYETERKMACHGFNFCHQQALAVCQNNCDAVDIRVAGRKADNETMARISCLLKVLMDVEVEDKTTELDLCKNTTYDVSFWNIDNCHPDESNPPVEGAKHCVAAEDITCLPGDGMFMDREYWSRDYKHVVMGACGWCSSQFES